MREGQKLVQTKCYTLAAERDQLNWASQVLGVSNSSLIRKAIAQFYSEALEVQHQQEKAKELQQASLFEVVEPGIVVTGAYGTQS